MSRRLSPRHIDFSTSWMIGNEPPAGLLASLIISAANTVREPAGSIEVSATITRPLAAGAILATVTPDEQSVTACIVHGAGTVVEMSNQSGGGDLTAIVISRRCQPFGVVPMPELAADDLLSYGGDQPGLSAMFEVRPLPIGPTNRGTSTAWVRPNPQLTPLDELWLRLVALDSWAHPAFLDEVRMTFAAGTPTSPTLTYALRELRLEMAPNIPDRPQIADRSWFLLNSLIDTNSDATSISESGVLADTQGNSVLRYNARREIITG